MCGIAGLIDFGSSGKYIDEEVKKMTRSLWHRGPDSYGIWLDLSVPLALGHRRLAIHDLTPTGHQPMQSMHGRYVIVFNGEIYNYLSLKDDLIKQGLKFSGSSDTEVLVNAIECWGVDVALQRSQGMFALALFDKKEKKLILARDRMGEKPLYFGTHKEKFYFASELKGILALVSSTELSIDKQGLYEYLKFGYISSPRSIYQEFKKLDPSSYLVIDTRTPSDYSINFYEDHIPRSLHLDSELFKKSSTSVIVNELDKTLNAVIKDQALSDVPLGAFLSGGVDSSLVSAILQSQSAIPINTFTIGFHEAAFNEAIHAKAVSKHIGSSHNELYISSIDALQLVPKLTEIYDEPFSDSSQIPMLIVSRLAGKKVTVCLSGDGGDELFCGYNRYFKAEQSIRISKKIPSPLRRLLGAGINKISQERINYFYGLFNSIAGRKGSANLGVKLQKFSRILDSGSAADIYSDLSSCWSDPNLIMQEKVSVDLGFNEFDFESDFLSSAMLWDQKFYLPGDNLVKTDRASMQSSIEMRLPLLDKRIVDFSRCISNDLKFREKKSKWILRQVLYRYVPEQLIERPKMGFSIPIGQWLREDLRSWAESLLDFEFIKRQGLFEYEFINSTWKEHISGIFDHGNKLWTLLLFQEWYLRQQINVLDR